MAANHWARPVPCPHCGYEWKCGADEWSDNLQLVFCDTDEGGCGADFAATVRAVVTFEVRSFKIEGRDPEPVSPGWTPEPEPALEPEDPPR